MRFELDPVLTEELTGEIVTLWEEVTNAGGAVGFAGEVTRDEVVAMATPTLERVSAGPDHLLLGYEDDRLIAMLIFIYGFKLNAHWRTVKRVMVHPDAQGRGHGLVLMREAERVARCLGWEGLFLTVRGGFGIERFYEALGYKEVGRLPGALRQSPGDDRDEIFMWLALV